MVVELGGVKVWMGWVWRTYECSDENTGDDGWDGARAGVACDASTSGESCEDECGGLDGLFNDSSPYNESHAHYPAKETVMSTDSFAYHSEVFIQEGDESMLVKEESTLMRKGDV